MMRRRTRMQDGLALLKVNINSLTEVGGVNLVPSTHAKAGFAEGQSVQDVVWTKDFIVWCFNRFRNGGDTVCSPSFCWSFGVKIVQTESRACKLACKLCRGAAYLDLGDKDSANREQSLKLAYKLCRGAAYLDLGDKVMY